MLACARSARAAARSSPAGIRSTSAASRRCCSAWATSSPPSHATRIASRRARDSSTRSSRSTLVRTHLDACSAASSSAPTSHDGACRELVQRRILRRLAEPELGELERLVGGTSAQGIRRRTLHGIEHDLDGAGRRGVVGDRHVVGLVGFEQRGECRLVDPAPFAAEESGAHRLADERVPEREHVDLVLDEQAGGDEPAQRVDQRSLARSGHRARGDRTARAGRGPRRIR